MTPAPQWVVRPAVMGDLDALVALAEALGPGMTTFPADRAVIADKIADSQHTFATENADGGQYLLVLEDLDSATVCGIAGIYPSIGAPFGFFSYKVTRVLQQSARLSRRNDVEMLVLSNDLTGATEVGTLAIAPHLRGARAGRMLARSRYMLMASHPQRFNARVVAEMRGWQDDAGDSPFWNAVGAKFFAMPFATADLMSAVDGNGFIADLMPRMPIYTALLPEDAREAVGKAHAVSARAMAMLRDEGFRYDGYIDVFDGGPQVQADLLAIRTIADGRDVRVRNIGASSDAVKMTLVSNARRADFRMIELEASVREGEVRLSDDARRALDIMDGAPVRIC